MLLERVFDSKDFLIKSSIQTQEFDGVNLGIDVDPKFIKISISLP